MLLRPMGLFRKLGKQVEQFKQDAKSAADEGAEYECAACGERFHAPQDVCTECGSNDIVAITAEADETPNSDSGDSET